MKTIPSRRVFFRYSTPAGPITHKAGIGLTSLPCETLSVSISPDVCWTEAEDYSEHIIDEIISLVAELVSEPFGAKLLVTEVELCKIGSSESSVKIATQEAVKSLLSIGSLIEFNQDQHNK